MTRKARNAKRLGLARPVPLQAVYRKRPTLRELNRRCRPSLDERELESVALENTIALDPAAAIPTTKAVSPRALAEVEATVRRHLHLPDLAPLHVVLATEIANFIHETLERQGKRYLAEQKEGLRKALCNEEILTLSDEVNCSTIQILMTIVGATLRFPRELDPLSATTLAILLKLGLRDFCLPEK